MITVLEGQVGELEKKNRGLQEKLAGVEVVLHQAELEHEEFEAYKDLHPSERDMKVAEEALQAELAREDEKAEATQLMQTLHTDNTRLHDELDEVHSLLEQVAFEKAEAESKLLAAERRAEAAEENVAGAESSLGDELAASTSEADSEAIAAEKAELAKQLALTERAAAQAKSSLSAAEAELAAQKAAFDAETVGLTAKVGDAKKAEAMAAVATADKEEALRLAALKTVALEGKLAAAMSEAAAQVQAQAQAAAAFVAKQQQEAAAAAAAKAAAEKAVADKAAADAAAAAAVAVAKLSAAERRAATAEASVKEQQVGLAAAEKAAEKAATAAEGREQQLQLELQSCAMTAEATLRNAAETLKRRVAGAEEEARRLEQRLTANANDQNATVATLEKENSLLQAQLALLKNTKFKGMTVSEQAQLFEEKIELKMDLDDLSDQLISAKAEAAKAEWENEHQRLYEKNRNRILFTILSGPLTENDRKQVVQMLQETDGDEPGDDGGAGGDFMKVSAGGAASDMSFTDGSSYSYSGSSADYLDTDEELEGATRTFDEGSALQRKKSEYFLVSALKVAGEGSEGGEGEQQRERAVTTEGNYDMSGEIPNFLSGKQVDEPVTKSAGQAEAADMGAAAVICDTSASSAALSSSQHGISPTVYASHVASTTDAAAAVPVSSAAEVDTVAATGTESTAGLEVFERTMLLNLSNHAP
jgi:hypothetical protein